MLYSAFHSSFRASWFSKSSVGRQICEPYVRTCRKHWLCTFVFGESGIFLSAWIWNYYYHEHSNINQYSLLIHEASLTDPLNLILWNKPTLSLFFTFSPKCRSQYSQRAIPTRYLCFCGKKIDPAFDPWLPPHSCGEICGRKLKPLCGHSCLLLCHPGGLLITSASLTSTFCLLNARWIENENKSEED